MSTTTNMVLTQASISETFSTLIALLNANNLLIDAHDHSSGKGTSVTPSGFSWNSDLSARVSNVSYSATNLKKVNFYTETAALSSATTNSIYVVNGELYFNNTSGTSTQMTSAGALFGAGIIEGMSGTTATVTYNNSSKLFTFLQNTSHTASLAAGSIRIYEPTLSITNYVNLISPISLGATPTITLPSVTGTLATLAGTEVLTSKTINASSNTLSNISSSMITGTTGTGNFVLQGTPTLTTPVLGVATATSINKTAITAPATSSTLAVADGKTLTSSNTLTLTGTDGITCAFGGGLSIAATKILTCSNTLTFSGTDSSSISFGTGGTVVYSGGALSGTTLTATNTSNQIVLGTTNTTTISSTAPAASRIYTIPDFGAAGYIPIATTGNNCFFTTTGATTVTLPTTGTLATTAVTTLSSLASIGTITTGVWNGTAVDVAHGGTGLTTLTTAHGVVCAGTTATGVLQNAGVGTSGQVLTSNGAALPTWQAASPSFPTRIIAHTTGQTYTGGGAAQTVLWTEVLDADSTFASNTFTCPTSGVYHIEAYLRVDLGLATDNLNMSIFVNGSIVSTIAAIPGEPRNNSTTASYVRWSGLLNLSATNTVTIQVTEIVRGANMTLYVNEGNFCIFRVA